MQGVHKFGQKNDKTIVKYYGICRLVQMDESHFAGAPKYGKGRCLGEKAWKNCFIMSFVLTERGSLDCVLTTVDSSHSRKTLLPIINDNCLPGTILCSYSWKAHYAFLEHLNLEDFFYIFQ